MVHIRDSRRSLIIGPMRRFFVLLPLVGALVIPGLAGSAPTAPGDGTLSVKDGKGTIVIWVKGGVIGRFAEGQITVTDQVPYDDRIPQVWGAEEELPVTEKKTVYPGKNVRFLLTGGTYVVRINATDIDLSVVGKGVVKLRAAPGVDNVGTFSLNGEEPRPLPKLQKDFPLRAPATKD